MIESHAVRIPLFCQCDTPVQAPHPWDTHYQFSMVKPVTLLSLRKDAISCRSFPAAKEPQIIGLFCRK